MGRRAMIDPRAEWDTTWDLMERLMDEGWGRRGLGRRGGERVHMLPVDVYSTPNELVIQASVPGLDPEDLEITIEGEAVTIRGERKAPLENVEYYVQERRYGPFARVISLNVPVQADAADAVFDKGVLTLTIPKAQEVRPKIITVKSK
jgi:HSP20 family protein